MGCESRSRSFKSFANCIQFYKPLLIELDHHRAIPRPSHQQTFGNQPVERFANRSPTNTQPTSYICFAKMFARHYLTCTNTITQHARREVAQAFARARYCFRSIERGRSQRGFSGWPSFSCLARHFSRPPS